MRTDSFDYDLPSELIAQTPIEPRDNSRLLVLRRDSGAIEHRRFRDIGDYLAPRDLLLANESRVLRVRLHGVKTATGGKVEALLLRSLEVPGEAGNDRRTWEALISPGRRVREGTRLTFGPEGSEQIEAEVVGRGELGSRHLRFSAPVRPALERLGEMPLPPYIHERLANPERYQTVYARAEGSAAAPTAGLHFTPRLIGELQAKGVGFATVVLHVGLDTFRPVREANLEEHKMHLEWYELGAEAARTISETRARGGRVVAVGTTSVRTLETVARDQGLLPGDRKQRIRPANGWSDLFIAPGYRFTLVDAMVTNFHLPRTTLIMLVSAFAGREHVLAAYMEAVKERYRFFSFGDAMLMI